MDAAARRVVADLLRRLEDAAPPGPREALLRALLAALPDAMATGSSAPLAPLAAELGVLAQRRGAPLTAFIAAAQGRHDEIMRAIIAELDGADRAGLEALLRGSRVLRELAGAALAVYQDRATAALAEQAATDGLTRLANRRAFDARLEGELERARRHGHALAVVLLDLDGLKRANDGHGHARGDALLVALADALRAQARGADLVARIGGDEFAALLPETGRGGATALVRRLARAVVDEAERAEGAEAADGEAEAGGVGRGARPVRFSAGVAVYPEDGEDAAALLRRADRRMYAAKRRPRGG